MPHIGRLDEWESAHGLQVFAEAICNSIGLAPECAGPFSCSHDNYTILVRRCVHLVEDSEHWSKPVFTGGLLLVGEVYDLACVLYPDERRRLVRIRPGWKVENLARSLVNMGAFLRAAAQLRDARLGLSAARAANTDTVLPASSAEAGL